MCFRLRRKGGKMLLSKYTLLFIVALNILDCALVLGELILDLHHVKGEFIILLPYPPYFKVIVY